MIVEKFDNVEDFIKELPKYLGMCRVHPSCLEYLSDIRVQLSELNSYKDAEEQGLLLRLPCKVGDTVYSVVKDGLQIFELKFSLDFYVRRMSDFGKTVFLTKEEAGQALETMKRG